jgi:hypothetical protein
MLEGKYEVCPERYAPYAFVCQFTSTTFEIPLETTEVSDLGRGSVGSPTTGREPILEDRSNNRGAQGRPEESNISIKPEQD